MRLDERNTTVFLVFRHLCWIRSAKRAINIFLKNGYFCFKASYTRASAKEFSLGGQSAELPRAAFASIATERRNDFQVEGGGGSRQGRRHGEARAETHLLRNYVSSRISSTY